MADRRASVVASVLGVSAGLSASLPSFVCPGVPCSSCFGCLGVGGAAASALLVGWVSRRLGPARLPGRGGALASRAVATGGWPLDQDPDRPASG